MAVAPCYGPRPIRVLELYSGIGGMRYSLHRAFPGLTCQVKAVDINQIANKVYQHNFKDQPSTLSLEYCGPRDLLLPCSKPPDLWTLSPPCQPFTTTSNSLQQDSSDPRTTSFMHLLELIQQMADPPSHILLENVPGFLGSHCHSVWQKAMDAVGYEVRHI
jgi:tRNA (cytosine38-C5)-methyltransferase